MDTSNNAQSTPTAVFLEHYEERMRTLQQHWRQIQFVQWSSKTQDAMAAIVHTLLGGAKTIQLNPIIAPLEQLDRLLHELQGGETPPNRAQKDTIHSLLEQLAALDISSLNVRSAAASSTPTPPAHAANGELVYLVDDDPVIRSALTPQLNAAGFKVKPFADLKMLYAALQRETPSAIVLDVVFPQGALAGINALETLQLKTGLQVPVVFISSRSDMVARLKALRSGGRAFFTKPVNVAELTTTLEQLISRQEHKYKVLLIDDDPVCSLTHQHYLETANFQTQVLEDPLQALNELSHFQPDVLVLDLMMPQCDGIELAKLLRQSPDTRYLPIIFLSATEDPQQIAQLQVIPNTRFLQKPVESELLVQNCLNSARQYRYLQHRANEGATQTDHKQVSRYELLGHLESELHKASEAREPLCLLYASFDELATLRSACSDTVLNDQFGQIIARQVTGLDSYAAISTGVTVALLTHPASSLEQYAQQLDKRMAGSSILNNAIQIRFSLIDLSNFNGHASGCLNTAEMLFNRAVQHQQHYLLSAAGETTKAPAQASAQANEPRSDGLKREMTGTHTSEKGIAQALSEKAFSLIFQPIVNVSDPEFEGFDTLLRLQGDNNELLLPELFLPIAHKKGLDKEMDRWVIDCLLKLAAQDNRASMNSTFFVKITTESVKNKILLSLIGNLLKQYRIRGQGRLVLEYKLADLLANTEAFLAFADMARKAECHICVADFDLEKGQALLPRILPEYLKIKAKDIRKAANNPTTRQSLANFVQDASHKMIKVIASNVEDVSTIQSCYTLGITHLIGYAVQTPTDSLERLVELDA